MNFSNALDIYNEMLRQFSQSSADIINDENSTIHTEPINSEEE